MDLVQQDPGLPGLATVLDPEALAERLARELSGIEIQKAECRYVRYKPGTNCLAAHRVLASGEWQEVYAKAYRPADAHKVSKAIARAQTPTGLGPGKLLWTDLLTVVCLFPNDDQIRSLRRLGEATTRARLLRKALPAHPGLWSAELRPLAYKPDRRFVGQLRGPDGDLAVVRQYSRSGFTRIGRARTLPVANGCLRLARPLGRSERHRFVVLEWLEGRLLGDALRASRFDARELKRVGWALAELHRSSPEGLVERGSQDAVKGLRAVAEAVGFLAPGLEDDASRLAAHVAWALGEMPKVMGTIHGDFYSKQVLLQEKAVAVIDLDSMAFGDPLADVGNFIAHLERDSVRGSVSSDRVDTYRCSLLEGYRESGLTVRDGAVDVHTAAALLRLTPHPFRNRESRWREQMERLLARARTLLHRSSRCLVSSVKTT
ncbi:MAG TPA: phosphotransferase [Vicinamibacteria bacterium]|nr:phosphotransferase [Vicinamibacteria bacterium]